MSCTATKMEGGAAVGGRAVHDSAVAVTWEPQLTASLESSRAGRRHSCGGASEEPCFAPVCGVRRRPATQKPGLLLIRRRMPHSRNCCYERHNSRWSPMSYCYTMQLSRFVVFK